MKARRLSRSGQMVSARGGAINVNVMVLDHQHYDECGANGVDESFQE